ncbi:MAG: PDZ domain-containing protein [Phycisphaerales bacterium]|nr:PDZ domain-containing protein [Phycisphaerales bacterium]
MTPPRPRRPPRPAILATFPTLLTALTLAISCPCRARAQPAAPPAAPEQQPPEKAPEDPSALSRRAVEAFERHDYPTAESCLRRQLELQPGNYIALYNLACVRAAIGDATGAADLLLESIEQGFDDIRQLRRDPSLDAVRADPRIAKVMAHWAEVLDARLEGNLDGLTRLFPDSYERRKDPALRLAYLSAFDARTFEQARNEVETVGAWGLDHVFIDLRDPPNSDPANPGPQIPDPWVIVILPKQEHFLRWALATYGPDAINSFRAIGGSYDHDEKRLVTQDIGATLRHEFFHVLHWRSMNHAGQVHAIWIQEGLCSLVEDYDKDDKGRIEPTPSWRTNIAKRLEKAGRLTPIEKLGAMTQAQFVSSRPLANYAQARAFFLYLWQRGKLDAWYARYLATYREDATGIRAAEIVMDMPVADLNKDYRAWLRNLPAVPEEIAPGKASLGVEVEPGDGDGPVVASIVKRRGSGPSLILGDTISAINGRPTRDIAELVRVLSDFQVGQTVTINYRRGSRHGTLELVLVPASSGLPQPR